MKEEQDYISDITEIRSLMERSSKFMSVSGLAGVTAGIYALSGVLVAYKIFNFSPDQVIKESVTSAALPLSTQNAILVAFITLVLTLGTAIILSYRKAAKRRENFWSPTAKKLIITMAVPLVTGGLLLLILIYKAWVGLFAPVTLLFYGIALYNAGSFTYKEMKGLGLINIVFGLLSTYYLEYGLLFWALGFGLFHIVYGIYIHYRYEK